MAWDKTKPTDQSKIRTYPTLLTDNFKAIEEGDQGLQFWQTRFDDRDVLGIASNPTRADDEMAIFSKSDGSNTEMFIMDDQDPANIIQITEVGSLGSQNTNIVCNQITIGGNDIGVTENSVVVAWGKFNSSGTFQYGVNMATAGTPHPSTGLFNVNVSADILSTANYMIDGVVARTGDSSGSVRGLMPISLPTPVASTATTIQVEIKRDGGRTDTFSYFFIQVIGGQS